MTPTNLNHRGNGAPHEHVVEYADDAYAAIRALNHATIGGLAMPAPTVYAVLRSLGPTGHGLHQAIYQLTSALAASVHAYDLYEVDGSDPTQSIARAGSRMVAAADHARRLARLLDVAQIPLTWQGYHHHDPGDLA